MTNKERRETPSLTKEQVYDVLFNQEESVRSNGGSWLAYKFKNEVHMCCPEGPHCCSNEHPTFEEFWKHEHLRGWIE